MTTPLSRAASYTVIPDGTCTARPSIVNSIRVVVVALIFRIRGAAFQRILALVFITSVLMFFSCLRTRRRTHTSASSRLYSYAGCLRQSRSRKANSARTFTLQHVCLDLRPKMFQDTLYRSRHNLS